MEFRLDWKVAPGTNSGVKYRNANFEYQILDNSSKPKKLLNPRQAAASIYFGVGVPEDGSEYVVGPWLSFDPNTERCVGDHAEEANALLKDDNRAGFKVPKVADV